MVQNRFKWMLLVLIEIFHFIFHFHFLLNPTKSIFFFQKPNRKILLFTLFTLFSLFYPALAAKVLIPYLYRSCIHLYPRIHWHWNVSASTRFMHVPLWQSIVSQMLNSISQFLPLKKKILSESEKSERGYISKKDRWNSPIHWIESKEMFPKETRPKL